MQVHMYVYIYIYIYIGTQVQNEDSELFIPHSFKLRNADYMNYEVFWSNYCYVSWSMN